MSFRWAPAVVSGAMWRRVMRSKAAEVVWQREAGRCARSRVFILRALAVDDARHFARGDGSSHRSWRGASWSLILAHH